MEIENALVTVMLTNQPPNKYTMALIQRNYFLFTDRECRRGSPHSHSGIGGGSGAGRGCGQASTCDLQGCPEFENPGDRKNKEDRRLCVCCHT